MAHDSVRMNAENQWSLNSQELSLPFMIPLVTSQRCLSFASNGTFGSYAWLPDGLTWWSDSIETVPREAGGAMYRTYLKSGAVALLLSAACFGQTDQSLGDVARANREKQSTTQASGVTPRVI